MTAYRSFPELASCSGVLTVELNDLAGRPPPPLDRDGARRLATAMAADLSRILGGIEHLGMVAPAALYDQTELLRPGLPLLQALEDIFKGTLREADYTPQLLALGSDSGRFPIAAIDPARAPGSGPLLLLPFTLVGYRAAVTELAGVMENRLLQDGEVSAATRRLVQEGFGIAPRNLSYATVADLFALLKVQLDSNGFGPLWELLEHALFSRPGPRQAVLETGNRFVVDQGRVYTPFYTFDAWAGFGPGRDLEGAELGAGYAAWTRAQRQYGAALAAYGLTLRQVAGAPGLDRDQPGDALAALLGAPALDGDYLVETASRTGWNTDARGTERRLEITHQQAGELGTLAYTVLALDAAGSPLALEHYYPLTPSGLETLIRDLKARSEGLERQVLHPDGAVWSAGQRRLLPAGAGLPPADRRH